MSTTKAKNKKLAEGPSSNDSSSDGGSEQLATQPAAQAPKQPQPVQSGTREWHFTMQDDPTERPSREELTKRRSVVMHNWLKQHNGDPRAKRRGTRGVTNEQEKTESSSNYSSHSSTSQAVVLAPPLETQPSTIVTRMSGSSAVDVLVQTKAVNSAARAIRSSSAQLEQPTQQMAGQLAQHDRMRSIASPLASWPTSSGQDYMLSRLNWTCSRCFGSPGLSQLSNQWIPALMRHDAAFYSTVCVAVAYDDAMLREMTPSAQRTPVESYQGLVVRNGAIKMIHERLRAGIVDDGTIMAVVMILSSEMINGEMEHINAHIQGLHNLIAKGRTINGLGMNGLLARIVVICMYMANVLAGETPDQSYALFAGKIKTEPPTIVGLFPEYPIYASAGFSSTKTGEWKTDALLHLVQLIQQASDAFMTLYGLTEYVSKADKESVAQAARTLEQARDGVFGFAEPQALRNREAATFEIVRLAARIHVEALYHCVPYSEAGRLLDTTTTIHDYEQSCEASIQTVHQKQKPIIVRFREALKRIDIEEVQGPRSGVLLWTELVVFAATLPVIDHVLFTDKDVKAECMAARRFVAAIYTRCASRQMFEHTIPMLGMLKRFIVIQSVLRTKQASATSVSAMAHSSQCEQISRLPDVGTTSIANIGPHHAATYYHD